MKDLLGIITLFTIIVIFIVSIDMYTSKALVADESSDTFFPIEDQIRTEFRDITDIVMSNRFLIDYYNRTETVIVKESGQEFSLTISVDFSVVSQPAE